MFKQAISRLKSVTKQQLAIAGVFVVAMIASASLGLATNQRTSAQVERDCDTNSINYTNSNGGCGALSPAEQVADMRQNNPNDLQVLYSDARFANLPASMYDRFAQTAKMGLAYRNGDVIVDNQTVVTGAHSMGRKSWGNPNRHPVTINGKTYYESTTQNSYASGVNAIPVMVMFDDNGVVEAIIMTACGNPVWGTKVTPSYDCKMLNKTDVAGQKNTYDFSSNIVVGGNASIASVVYDFGDGSDKVTKNNGTDVVRHQYTTPGNYTAKVTVTYKLPGGKTVTPTVKVDCTKQITVLAPYYACTVLQAVALDTKKQQFQFTAKPSFGNGATLKAADFTVDGKNTITGVAANGQGNFVKTFTFTDTAEHTVKAVIHFDVDGKDVTSKEDCLAKVTSEKTPMCTVKGKENLPPNDEKCYEECKPGVKVGSPECTPVQTPPELPHTGMGSVVGLFGGVSAAGAVAHRLFNRRKTEV